MNSLLDRFAAPLDLDAMLAAWSPRWARGRGLVESIVPRTATSASIRIRPGRGWRGHQAGQHVTVGVDVDGVRHARCYSLTSTPADRDVEITVQAVDGGTVSRHLVHAVRPGDVVALGRATGDFTLPATRRPLLFLTGGSGITPAMGMVRTLALRAGAAPDVVVLHHAPTADRVIFGDELADLAHHHPWLRLDLSLTQAGGRRLDADRLEARCPDWRDRKAYACGPAALLDFATGHWADAGVLDRLHVERFTPLVPVGAPGDGGTVTFAASGSATPATSSTTLLAAAEDHGLLPPAGCRNGICHTCTTPLLAGCARDLRDGRLVEAGAHVQLCVTAAAGDVTLDL
jgi:ferredoxin-NADP reductase